MDNSIYITLSNQLTLFRDMDVTANNIANADTVGYKAEKLSFHDHLVDGVLDGKRGNELSYARDPESYRDTTTGSMKVTGNALDTAINGPGYFMVDTPLGKRFTKAGNFQIDGNGTLMTPQGYPVLSQDGGVIELPDNAKNILISDDGRINIDGDDVAQIGVVEFGNEQAMKRLGNNLYSADGQQQKEATQSHVVQGAIESSNVTGVTELVRVVELQRSVANTAKFIEAMYDLERRTASTYTKTQTA